MKWMNMAAGVVLAGLISSAQAFADDQPSPLQGGSPRLAITKHFVGSLASIGSFPGRLVQLPCAPDQGPVASSCEQGHALIVDGDEVVHPLLPGTDEMRTALSAPQLQDTEVRVQGKYYSSTGTILVNSIVPQCDRANC